MEVSKRTKELKAENATVKRLVAENDWPSTSSSVNGNLEMTGGGRLVCPLAAGQ